MPVGQAPLDPRLALQKPVEHVQHLVAGDGPELEQGSEAGRRGLRIQRPCGGELGGGIENPRRDGGEREVPAPLLPAPEKAPEAEPPHHSQHGGRVAVRQRPADREGLAGVVEDDPAPEHGAEPVDDGGIEVREVGDGLVAHAPSLAPCPSEEDGPGPVLVGDHVDSDGHSSYVSCFLPVHSRCNVVHGFCQGLSYVSMNPSKSAPPAAESRCVSARWRRDGADDRPKFPTRRGPFRTPSRPLRMLGSQIPVRAPQTGRSVRSPASS